MKSFNRLTTVVSIMLANTGVFAADQPMSFFVTSQSGPDGANFGGLAGAVAHCQSLATTAGAGSKTWRAYLVVPA